MKRAGLTVVMAALMLTMSACGGLPGEEDPTSWIEDPRQVERDEEAGQGGQGGQGAWAADGWGETEIEDGATDSGGRATFTLDPAGPRPVTLKTQPQNVKTLERGYAVDGDLYVLTPGGPIKLSEAKLELTRDSARGPGLQRVSGTSRVPFPDMGLTKGVSLDAVVYASVGYDYGENITNAQVPLNAGRRYLYFVSSAGLGATLGGVQVKVADGVSTTIALDPSDPTLLLRGDLLGFAGLNRVGNAGIGLSWQGLIPYTPARTWGVEGVAKPFTGHLWLGGSLSLVAIPVKIDGGAVLDLDTDGDGKTLLTDKGEGFQLGTNSDLAVSFGFELTPLQLEVPLNSSSLLARVSKHGSWAHFSGEIAPEKTWLPSWLAFKPIGKLRAAGYVNAQADASYLTAQGDGMIDASVVSGWTGWKLSDLGVSKATLKLDRSGLMITGKSTSVFTPLVGLNGEAELSAHFSGSKSKWHVRMDGDLSVQGISLSSNASLVVDPYGIRINGTLNTPVNAVAMSGTIADEGTRIEGTTKVTIPIQAGKQIVQTVTDVAVCGYETVTDAAVCGYQTVTDAAKCGSMAVTSAAACGYITVTSAAKCGTHYVTSAATCGTKTVTSASICGVETLWGVAKCGAKCVGSMFKKCSCTKPKTCTVARSCWAPRTCKVAATCKIANTCSVPGTCKRVATCDKTITIPDFDHGTFIGSVKLTIGDAGLTGEVKGTYCTTGGSCVKVGGGHLELTSGAPRACVKVPALKQDFCSAI